MARNFEDQHRRVRVGDLPPPKPSDTLRDFAEVVAEYLALGRSCGGVGGRPWAEEHAEKRATGLNWWKTELGLAMLADLDGVLPRVEKALRDLQTAKKSSLTIQHRATCLTAFCHWCEQRGLVDGDPLKGLVPFPKQARETRRALTVGEVQKLLANCAPSRRLIYEVALASGLRANELRSLKVADLDAARGGLRLRGEWTKNRKAGFQPLPSFLVPRLVESATGKGPDEALLAVGLHTTRDLDKDLEAADLTKRGPGGKVDFHALRVAYTTFVIEAGANI